MDSAIMLMLAIGAESWLTEEIVIQINEAKTEQPPRISPLELAELERYAQPGTELHALCAEIRDCWRERDELRERRDSAELKFEMFVELQAKDRVTVRTALAVLRVDIDSLYDQRSFEAERTGINAALALLDSTVAALNAPN